MNKNKYLLCFRVAAASALVLACSVGSAQPVQTYPRKPIRLVVGFPAGGVADASARPVATHMGKSLGVTLVVENRGGAAGSVAGQIAAQAPADGYTLLWSSPGALTINRILEKNLPYNADTAFTPVGRAFTFCNALIVRQDSALISVAQFIALAKEKEKEKSGQLQYGTQGIGSAGHLSAQMLQNIAGITMSVVPYKGGTDILTAIVSGEVPSAFLSSTSAGTMRGRVRILAVTSLNRDPSLPDVPSMHEAGVKNYDASFWFGLLVPTGTPAPIVNRLNKALRDALDDAEVGRVSRAQGLNPAPSTPAEFAVVIKADYEKWRRVIVKS
jgi:tripartite-type tricarboxylate transporter receptor subunit TctC